MATYADILRNRKRAVGLRESAQQARGQQFGPTVTPRGQFQGMGGMTMPTPQNIDWGNIIQRGMGAYTAASQEKKADTLEAEADRLNEQFMNETLGSDEQAMRLYKMTQAGVPGADKALAEHISPKKEAMAGFLQFIQSGGDPALAAEIGPKYGISAEMARAAADYASRRATDKSEAEHAQALELEDIKGQNRLDIAAMKRSGGEMGLTPGERSQRSRMMGDIDKELMAAGQSDTKYNEARTAVERDNAFGATSKTSEFLAESPVRILSAIGKSMQSEGQLKLKDYLTNETLRRMAMLGGSDSNEELNRIAGSLPSAMNDKQAALGMLEALHNWEKITRLAVKMRRDDIQSGEWFSSKPSENDYYQRAKQIIQSGGTYSPSQEGGPAGIPTQQGGDVESMLDELGIQ